MVQLINTGIIILLVNAKIPQISTWLPDFIPLFDGKYNDFSVHWYKVVGSTIMFTMFINVFTPHIGPLIGYFKSRMGACCQRKCSCDPKKTKQRLQEDYEDDYTGPEFLIEVRYSQILASWYIIMIYSSGMPILYFIGMLQFYFMFWVDKYLCKCHNDNEYLQS